MAFFLIPMLVAGASSATTIGATIWQSKESEKVAAETKRLQGEWSYKDALADSCSALASIPQALRL